MRKSTQKTAQSQLIFIRKRRSSHYPLFKEKADLKLRGLVRIRPMDNVLLIAICEVVADCPRSSLLWVGRTDKRPESTDGVLSFERHRDTRAGTHELHQAFIERFASVHSIEFSSSLWRQTDHLHRADLKACLFDSTDNFPNEFLPDTIGFQDRQCSI
jgi:hypothetical protein